MKIFKSGEITHAVFTNKYFLTSSTCVWRQQKFRGWNFKRQNVSFLSLRYHFYFNSISKNMFHSQNRTSTTGASGPLVARGPLLESLQLSSNVWDTVLLSGYYKLIFIGVDRVKDRKKTPGVSFQLAQKFQGQKETKSDARRTRPGLEPRRKEPRSDQR